MEHLDGWGQPVGPPSRIANRHSPSKARSSSSISSATDLLELINSPMLDNISEKVASITRGRLDVRLFIAACLGIKTAANTLPIVLGMVFDQIKTNVSSSLAVSQDNHKLYDGLRRLAQERAEVSGNAWYQFSGEHGVQLEDGHVGNCPGKTQKFFRHDGTLFILETDGADAPQPVQNTSQANTSQMVVRCFGHTHAPIRGLFEHVIRQHNESEELTCLKVVAGCSDVSSTCKKRPLSTIDLDPTLKDYISRDAGLFFGDDSPVFYENTGQPYRRGYLLYGPPGTGKTSVSKAIASHFNVPLVLITLKGMDDKDLMDAFGRLPYRCVVLLEDIDCAGADVNNRDAKPVTGPGNSKGKPLLSPAELEAAKSALLEAVNKQNAIDRQRLIDDMDNFRNELSQDFGYPTKEKRSKKPRIVDPNKRVSLSGLLNVIDGADAAEGRLLIMTTNCPEKLDPALLRAGRCDEKFKIDYATKVTAQLTFKRIFRLDEQTTYNSATIDRFADALVSQFPLHSKISTAELAKYFGQYRGRPRKAIEDFADWVKLGDDLFAYRVEDLASDLAKGEYNVPGTFDRALLNVGPEDLVDVKIEPESKGPAAEAVPAHCENLPQSYSWNPFQWGRNSQSNEVVSTPIELIDAPAKVAGVPWFLEGFLQSQGLAQAPSGPGLDKFRQPSRQAQAISFYHGLGLVVNKTEASRKLYQEFSDDASELDHLLEPAQLRSVSPRPTEDSSALSQASLDDFLNAAD
ncbi:hypothetical protein DE146DRAFT_618331 [Phaeosphaeria sp. MPI-PUGE-AT-0046c]|nr:hypothetical protein DE146DRAFT_618331 [Phaeosphaeria sp. MPI-PUGE-AT-0046c]